MSRSTGVLFLVALVLAGCVTGVVDDGSGSSTPKCADPVRGSRYALCGRLSTAGLDTAAVNGKHFAGNFDSASQKTSSSRYSLRGGSFHAHR